jgi:predicted transcriptional regulator/transcriptional regulator with XRE-family HTH domain
MDKILAGHKLRRFRQALDLSQSAMAETLGISPSYLNLLEHNQRPLTAAILLKIGSSFNINIMEFAEDDTQTLVNNLSEIFTDPVMFEERVTRRDLQDMVTASPNVSRAIIKLFHAYRSVRDELENNAGAQGTPQVLSNSVEHVRHMLEKHYNYFAALEDQALELRNDIQTPISGISHKSMPQDIDFNALIRYIQEKQNITVRVMPADVMNTNLRRYDQHRQEILISEVLRRPQRIFHLLVQYALIEQNRIITPLITDPEKLTEQTISLMRITLAGYFAAAVMMPYSQFLQAAKTFRYDIDLLSRRFGVTFEQACHRLTTLNAPDEKGIPFAFVRIDDAGNISKRISAAGINFALHSGACPKWSVHRSFRNPEKTLVQAAELPNGQQVLSIARAVPPLLTVSSQPAPEFAIALGCELHHAGDIVYADQLDTGKNKQLETVGVNCSVCERLDCTQRSHPPIGYELRFDSHMRRVGLYDLDAN